METISKESLFEKAKGAFGTVPGIIKELSERSLPTAHLYTLGVLIMEKGTFSEMEINAIELKISKLNNCTSCMKGHAFLVKRAGLSDDDTQAILNSQPVSINRLNKLLRATEYIYHSGSDIFPEMVLDFLDDEEITQQEVIDIIGLLALKTISNYTNNYLAAIKNFQIQKLH